MPSPDGRTLALATGSEGENVGRAAEEGNAYLLDLPTGRIRYSLPVYPSPVGASVAFSPDGRMLALAADDGGVILWETATAKERLRLKVQRGAFKSLLFTPDRRGLLPGSTDTTVLLFDITSSTSALSGVKPVTLSGCPTPSPPAARSLQCASGASWSGTPAAWP